MRDYTVRVYAAEKVTIYDNTGKTNEVGGGHDLALWPEILSARANAEAEAKMKELNLAILRATAKTYQTAGYEKYDAGWYNEFTGPLRT